MAPPDKEKSQDSSPKIAGFHLGNDTPIPLEQGTIGSFNDGGVMSHLTDFTFGTTNFGARVGYTITNPQDDRGEKTTEIPEVRSGGTYHAAGGFKQELLGIQFHVGGEGGILTNGPLTNLQTNYHSMQGIGNFESAEPYETKLYGVVSAGALKEFTIGKLTPFAGGSMSFGDYRGNMVTAGLTLSNNHAALPDDRMSHYVAAPTVNYAGSETPEGFTYGIRVQGSMYTNIERDYRFQGDIPFKGSVFEGKAKLFVGAGRHMLGAGVSFYDNPSNAITNVDLGDGVIHSTAPKMDGHAELSYTYHFGGMNTNPSGPKGWQLTADYFTSMPDISGSGAKAVMEEYIEEKKNSLEYFWHDGYMIIDGERSEQFLQNGDPYYRTPDGRVYSWTDLILNPPPDTYQVIGGVEGQETTKKVKPAEVTFKETSISFGHAERGMGVTYTRKEHGQHYALASEGNEPSFVQYSGYKVKPEHMGWVLDYEGGKLTLDKDSSPLQGKFTNKVTLQQVTFDKSLLTGSHQNLTLHMGGGIIDHETKLNNEVLKDERSPAAVMGLSGKWGMIKGNIGVAADITNLNKHMANLDLEIGYDVPKTPIEIYARSGLNYNQGFSASASISHQGSASLLYEQEGTSIKLDDVNIGSGFTPKDTPLNITQGVGVRIKL